MINITPRSEAAVAMHPPAKTLILAAPGASQPRREAIILKKGNDLEPIQTARRLGAALALLLLTGGASLAADARIGRPAAPACIDDVRCRRPPGPPDRDIRPLIDPLGRPCGYRWRETPSGTRRVRICA
ncbi:hypothetical protein [Methylorubrum populi]